jgi:hypothetical protein
MTLTLLGTRLRLGDGTLLTVHLRDGLATFLLMKDHANSLY